MKFTVLLQLGLTAAFVQVGLGASIRQAEGDLLQDQDEMPTGLEARSLTNDMKFWLDQSRKDDCNHQPTYRSRQGADNLSGADVKAKAEAGFKSYMSDRQHRKDTAKPDQKPQTLSGGNLVATLHVPGVGDYSCSLPKGGIKAKMLADMGTDAPALGRQRGTPATRLDAEDGAIYVFEVFNKGWLEERGDRFPDGTKIAVYGAYDVNGSADDRAEKARGACLGCQETFRRMNIQEA